MGLVRVQKLQGYDLVTLDGNAGRVKDVVVDSSVWTVQYVVARPRGWLGVCDLLVPRGAIERLEGHRLCASVLRDELRPYVRSPHWRREVGQFVSSVGAFQLRARPSTPYLASVLDGVHEDLLSVRRLRGARLLALDGGAGRVMDVIVNATTWHVLALVVNTRGRLPGKRVLLPAQWVECVDVDGRIRTPLKRGILRNAPRFDLRVPVSVRDFDEFANYYSEASPAV